MTLTKAQQRAAWNVAPTATVVGFLGRLSTEKDPDAAYRLAVAMPSVSVVVVGDGPLAAVMRIGAPANLHIVGPSHNKASVISACDFMLVPSLYESFGLTIAEACWLGVPVIATAVGIASIQSGLVRPVPVSASGDQLAAAITADLNDPVGATQRVQAAQQYARQWFTMDRFARSYASVLATLAPTAIAGKIQAVLQGSVKLAALSPNLDLNGLVDTCPFSDGSCGCQGRDRPCSHPGRPDRVFRETCLQCQSGEMDS